MAMAMAMADESSSVSKPSSATSSSSSSSSSSSFFACYLLRSLNPRFRSSTYIGFTVNPKRRIRQHNGEISSGARKTKKKRPWEMILCVYGFPSNIHALQFEWAWQHPFQSVAVREAASILKLARGPSGKVTLLYTMLNLPEWKSLNLTVNILSTKHLPLTKGCPSLPSQMHVKVGTLDELPFHHIDFQGSDEHENGSDCDSQDEDDDEDGAKENAYRCLKSTISPNGHCQYGTTKHGSRDGNSCMPSNVLAEISNTIAHFSCDEPSEKPKRQGSSKQSKPDSKNVKCVPKSSQFSTNGVLNGRSGQLRTRDSSKSMEFSCSLSRISSQEVYESYSVQLKGNQSHLTGTHFSSTEGFEEPLPDMTRDLLQKDNQQHSKVLQVSREDHAMSLSYNTYDISCTTNNAALDLTQFSPLWSPSPAPAHDSNNRVMRGVDILSEDSMRKLRCSLSFSPSWRSRSIHLGDVFSSSHCFDEVISEDGKCSTSLFHSISTDSPVFHRKQTTINIQEFLPVRKQPIVIDLTDSPISK